MKPEVIDTLLRVNERFYLEQAQHFSDTRASAWKGWERCAEFVEGASARECGAACPMCKVVDSCESVGAAFSCRVLDAACGNMRFEAFLREALPNTRFSFTAVDNCMPLSSDFLHGAVGVDDESISFRKVDIVSALRVDDGRERLAALSFGGSHDVAVAFGFMHHIPTNEYRRRLLEHLISSVRLGGYVAVSFWRFMSNRGLAEKALTVHEQALCDLGLDARELEENDFIIGWNNKPGAYRYCHSFTSQEVDDLLSGFEDRVLLADRFLSDGRTDDLNEYVILRVL